MSSNILRIPVDTRRFYLVLACLILVAWGLLVTWQRSAYAELLGHESIGDDHFPLAWQLGAFLLNWIVMTVAMMLPGSLPLLNTYLRPIRQRLEGNSLAGLMILGYLFPWVVFGLLIYLGDSFLHHMFEPEAPLATFAGYVAPAIMLLAGLYQFTPLKRRSMARCRPSQSRFLQGGVEKIHRVGTLKQGLRLGIFCVGSCWSLMLLMFALGHNRLDWMLALGSIMAAERLSPWGHRLAWLVGLALVVWAAVQVLTQPALAG